MRALSLSADDCCAAIADIIFLKSSSSACSSWVPRSQFHGLLCTCPCASTICLAETSPSEGCALAVKGFAERAALGISGEGACVVAEPACTLPCHPLRVRCHVTPYALILCLLRSTCPDLQIARCLLSSWLRILSDTHFAVDRSYPYPHTVLDRGSTTLLTQT